MRADHSTRIIFSLPAEKKNNNLFLRVYTYRLQLRNACVSTPERYILLLLCTVSKPGRRKRGGKHVFCVFYCRRQNSRNSYGGRCRETRKRMLLMVHDVGGLRVECTTVGPILRSQDIGILVY